MKIEITKTFYDGKKSINLGSFDSLESAHYFNEHKQYQHQQTFDDIEKMDKSISFIHLMEFKNGEHYNDLFFTCKSI